MFKILNKTSTAALAIIAISTSVLISCTSTKTETKTIEVELTSDGPYFAGGNSLMNDYKPDLKTLVTEKELSKDQIESIKITSAKLNIPSDAEYTFDNFNSASLQLVSDNAPMTSVAILNPIVSAQSKMIDLTVSNEADIAPFFKEANFTYLLDLDFKEDDYSDAMTVNLLLELTIEYK